MSHEMAGFSKKMSEVRGSVFEKYKLQLNSSEEITTIITASNLNDVKVVLSGVFETINREDQVIKYSTFKILPPFIFAADFNLKASL
jgi:hypothetical protein